MITNSAVRLTAGIGLGAGIALYCALRAYKHNRSLFALAKRQAGTLMSRADDLRGSAADLLEKSREEAARQKKGIMEAVEAGQHAYLHAKT